MWETNGIKRTPSRFDYLTSARAITIARNKVKRMNKKTTHTFAKRNLFTIRALQKSREANINHVLLAVRFLLSQKGAFCDSRTFTNDSWLKLRCRLAFRSRATTATEVVCALATTNQECIQSSLILITVPQRAESYSRWKQSSQHVFVSHHLISILLIKRAFDAPYIMEINSNDDG